MFGVFNSREKRARKGREKLLRQAEATLFSRKAKFRENAIGKMLFLYPDMKFAVSAHSKEFSGYSATNDKYICGEFADDFLPDLTELRDSIEDPNFEEQVSKFIKEIRDYRMPTPIMVDGEQKDYSKFYFDRFLKSEKAKIGYSVRSMPTRAYEIKLYKNSEIVARTGKFSPKQIGYLAEKVYKNVVQDLKGTGVSMFTIEIGEYTVGYASSSTINYVYTDYPRKEESQSRDHYLKICSQFIEFLNCLELHVLDKPEGESIFHPDEEDINDRLIGLR